MKYGMGMLLSVFALAACSKPATAPYEGSYTFKTSGTVSLEVTADPLPEYIDPIVKSGIYDLTPESGRMDIAPDGNDTMVVSLNALGGDVQVFKAELLPGGFRLLPSVRTLRIGVLPPWEVTVSGTARRVGDELLLDLEYTGERDVVSGVHTVITDSDVVCWAKKN